MRASAGALAPLRAINSFVFAPEDPRRLAALRIGLFGLLAIRLAINDYASVTDQPSSLFDPISLFEVLPSMPSEGLAVVVQIVGVVAACLAAIGLWARLSLPLALAAAVFLNLMLNATGKVIHNDVLLVLCLIPLALVPTAATRTWSLAASRRRDAGVPTPGPAYGWPIRTAMIIVAFAYLFAGLQKLRYSGIDWVTSENLRWVLYASSDSQETPNEFALFIADRAWLAHLFAGGSLALELGFILCLPFAKLRWLMVPGVVSLHAGIWLGMGLDYSAQALTVILVFVNWVIVTDWVRELYANRRLSIPTEQRTPR